MKTTFHLALPSTDLGATRKFYVELLGASAGREGANWLDINLYGHQLTFTNAGAYRFDSKSYRFEKQIIPSFHFGIIVDNRQWDELYHSMHGKLDFELDKTHFLVGKIGAHMSFMVLDPNGFKLEFKSFIDANELFQK